MEDGPDYLSVTELSGSEVSREQVERLFHRYRWAAEYCKNKDVAEIACGTGSGLGLLQEISGTFEAGDYARPMLDRVRAHYGDRIKLRQFDAQDMPYADASKDVLIIFEAIYYLPDIDRFISECRRVLRPNGYLLIATANKDLSDFNPSPYSHRYLGVRELMEEFRALGSHIEMFGFLTVDEVSWVQRLLRPVKRLVVKLGLMPKTMGGKKFLKRLVFGPPVIMPAEVSADDFKYSQPEPLSLESRDRRHKVIYCVVRRADD